MIVQTQSGLCDNSLHKSLNIFENDLIVSQVAEISKTGSCSKDMKESGNGSKEANCIHKARSNTEELQTCQSTTLPKVQIVDNAVVCTASAVQVASESTINIKTTNNIDRVLTNFGNVKRYKNWIFLKYF